VTVAVATKDVAVTYPGPPTVEAVRGVSLTISEGEFVSIVGPSGSGKSSLLHLLGALLPASSGSVVIAGQDVAAMGDRYRNSLRAHHLGFVFQEFHLIRHRRVVDNVMVGSLYQHRSLRRRHRDARDALEDVGIGHLAASMPNQLSGGERQRVGIARALVGGPSLLLCDEPTGNLDSATTASILGLLSRLREDRRLTVVVVTHDSAVEKASDRSVQLVDGIVVS